MSFEGPTRLLLVRDLLAGIHYVVRIEQSLDRAHRVERRFVVLKLQVVSVFDAHSVTCRYRPTEVRRQLSNLPQHALVSLPCFLTLGHEIPARDDPIST